MTNGSNICVRVMNVYTNPTNQQKHYYGYSAKEITFPRTPGKFHERRTAHDVSSPFG